MNANAHHVEQRAATSLTRRQFGAVWEGVAAGLGATALAACGLPGQTPVVKTSEPVTVTYMSSNAEVQPEPGARVALLREFNQTNELKITVNLEEAGAATTMDKFKTLAASGTPPDLASVAYNSSGDLAAAGATIDFDGELKGVKDWARQRADIFPAILETGMWDGKLVGMPGTTNNVGMIYNRGLLQQFGVTFPKTGWTWEDFRGMAQTMQRPPVRWALSLHRWYWFVFLGTTGQRVVSRDNRKITVDTPLALETLEYLVGLNRAGLMPPDGATEQYRQATGDIAFESQGPYRIPTLRQVNAPDFGVTHLPVHRGKKEIFTEAGGHSLIVFGGTPPERRTASALVAKWLNAPYAQAQLCIKSQAIPVSKATMQDSQLQAFLKTDEQFAAFIELAPYSWRWPNVPSSNALRRTIGNGVTAVFNDEKGIREWLTGAQQEAQTLLDADVALMK